MINSSWKQLFYFLVVKLLIDTTIVCVVSGEPLQVWSRHWDHPVSRRVYLDGPDGFWWLNTFAYVETVYFFQSVYFWKYVLCVSTQSSLHFQGKLETDWWWKSTWQKSTSVPILVMQCSISEMVSTSKSWLHLFEVDQSGDGNEESRLHWDEPRKSSIDLNKQKSSTASHPNQSFSIGLEIISGVHQTMKCSCTGECICNIRIILLLGLLYLL